MNKFVSIPACEITDVYDYRSPDSENFSDLFNRLEKDDLEVREKTQTNTLSILAKYETSVHDFRYDEEQLVSAMEQVYTEAKEKPGRFVLTVSNKAVHAVGKEIVFPFPLADTLHKTGDRRFVEISEEHYNYFLNCLPPLVHKSNSFVCSEPNSDVIEEGKYVSTYITCREQAGRFFVRLATVKEYKENLAETIAIHE